MTEKILTKKFTLTDDVRERVSKKLAKLDKFFPADTEATVKLTGLKVGEQVEITIYRGSTIFRAEEHDKDYMCALDKAIEIIERQIRKNRTRLERKVYIKKDSFTNLADLGAESAEDELHISKVKRFQLLPMTVEEAILQMNLLSHEFFLFKNADTGVVSLVYKRKENDYGLIEPID